MSHRSRSQRFVAIASVLITLSTSGAASALQPLENFVSAARQHNPSNAEAHATRDAASADADAALGRALPGVSLKGTYTHNQYEVGLGGLTITPQNQIDGFATVGVPLVDLSKFARIAGANRAADAAKEKEKATQLEVEARVVQEYYQLAANIALAGAARTALETARANLNITREALAAGTATPLDSERASAEVERQSQQLTTAELQVKLSVRSLHSDTGVAASTELGLAVGDDLHPEGPLDGFLAGSATSPEVRAASLAQRAAHENARAQKLSLVPTLDAFATEHATNATAFLAGHNAAYAAGANLTWSFDFTTMPAIRAREAEASAAKAREERARIAVGDAVFQAWSAVEADIARSRSARVQADVSRHAADLARTRYRNGAATQLELIEADRDAFSAEAARIQTDADLLNARVQLRLASGTDPFAAR